MGACTHCNVAWKFWWEKVLVSGRLYREVIRVILDQCVSACSVIELLGGSSAMRLKRVLGIILEDMRRLLGGSILLRRSINFWVILSCFWSDSIRVWVASVAQFSGICGGTMMDLTCRVGKIGIVFSGWIVAVLNCCWGYGCFSGKGWHVACFVGALIWWLIRVLVGIHLLGSADSVNLWSQWIIVWGCVRLGKVGR